MKKNKYLRQALIMITIISAAALLFSSCSNKKTIPDSNYNNKITNSDSDKDINKDSNKDSNKDNKDSNKDNSQTEIIKGPEFSSDKYKGEPQFATKWTNSSDGSMSACIEGKGSEASEEGIGKIIIKDSKNNETILQLKDKSSQQSPLYISWWNNENILVVIGNGYGTVARRKSLYSKCKKRQKRCCSRNKGFKNRW